MFPTFSFFVRSILSSSALAASVPSAKSFFRFSSSSASRCWRFSRCSRIMRLLSMFGWKLSSSSESSIRSHLLSADARAKSQRGVCAGPSRTGAGREQDKLTSGSQFVKDMARPAERVVGEAAQEVAPTTSTPRCGSPATSFEGSKTHGRDRICTRGVEAPERFFIRTLEARGNTEAAGKPNARNGETTASGAVVRISQLPSSGAARALSVILRPSRCRCPIPSRLTGSSRRSRGRRRCAS